MPKKKRKYLPHRLTKEEKADPKLRKKLASCIKAVEKKSCPKSAKKNGKYDYKKCLYNPVAVCRASISGEKGNPKKEMTLADHAEAWWSEKGRKVSDRTTKAWAKMYEKWIDYAFD